MIDITKAEEAFKEYVQEFEPSIKVIRKIEHTYRVEKNSKDIAKSIGLNEEQVELATLIGLLHDVGRFNQLKKIGCFSDNKLDHAVEGCRVLFEEKRIRDFIEDDKYDDLIRKAILNHNNYSIADVTDEEELLFSKIIRDADKLDLLEMYVDKEWILDMVGDKYQTTNVITKEIYDAFLNNKQIPRNLGIHKTMIDIAINTIGFLYDINYEYTFKKLKGDNTINLILDNFEKMNSECIEELEVVRIHANEYLDGKIVS